MVDARAAVQHRARHVVIDDCPATNSGRRLFNPLAGGFDGACRCALDTTPIATEPVRIAVEAVRPEGIVVFAGLKGGVSRPPLRQGDDGARRGRRQRLVEGAGGTGHRCGRVPFASLARTHWDWTRSTELSASWAARSKERRRCTSP
jgi:hypothetical protein